MATKTKSTQPPKSKKYWFEAFPGKGTDWFLRTKTTGVQKQTMNITEGYTSQKAGVKRAAQSTVNGFDIPVARLNVLNAEGVVVESWVLRPKTKAQQIAVTDSTPTV